MTMASSKSPHQGASKSGSAKDPAVALAQIAMERAVGKATAAVAITNALTAAIPTIVSELMTHRKAQAENATRRAEIEKERVVELARIAGQKELLHRYLDQAFAERRLVLDTFIRALDQGLATGDTVLVAQMAAQLVEIVRTPLLPKMAEAAEALESGRTITLGGSHR